MTARPLQIFGYLPEIGAVGDRNFLPLPIPKCLLAVLKQTQLVLRGRVKEPFGSTAPEFGYVVDVDTTLMPAASSLR